MDFIASLALLAQEQAPANAPAPPDMFSTFLLPAIVVMFFYVFFIGRSDRREKVERENRLSALKKGDRVVTIGGVCGKVDSVDQAKGRVTLRIDKGVKMEFLKTAIERVETGAKKGKASDKDAETEE